jgi:hypothetical protein
MPPLTEVLVGVTAFTAGLSVGWIRRMLLQRGQERRLSPTDILFGAVISLLPFAVILAALLMLNRTREIQLVIGWAGVAGMLLSRLFMLRRLKG